MYSQKKINTLIKFFYKNLISILIIFSIFSYIVKPVHALVLDMEISVDKSEKLQLEKSMNKIHQFFNTQTGFVRAELNLIDGNLYKLEEEWDNLESYKNAINKSEFKVLERNVPGSSNWRAKDFIN